MMGPYAQAAALYWDTGWRGVLPLPARRKSPPPDGYTGHRGLLPSRADVQAWIEGSHGHGNIALRMPDDVIGLDVDNYDGKQGGATYYNAVQRWGSLPPTWRSTNRETGQGSILLFRVPPGLAWPGEVGPGVEIIQSAHRYAVVWPSLHPEGRTYRWMSPNGSSATMPSPAELPQLPATWVRGLTGGEARGEQPHAGLDHAEVTDWLDKHGGGEPCQAMRRCLDEYGPAHFADGSSRHDTARKASRRVTALAVEGHAGMRLALGEVQQTFHDSIAGDRSADPHEWRRLVNGAVQIAAAGAVVERDPCVPTAEPWSEPIPFLGSVTPAPFPLDALPLWLSGYVAEVARTTQTPPDLAGALVLATTSAACCGRVRLLVKPGWWEPSNLYVLIGLPPASRKSAVHVRITQPLRDAEQALRSKSAADIIAGTARQRAAKQTVKEAEKNLDHKQSSVDALVEALKVREEAEKGLRAYPRLITADATPEALTKLLEDQDGRIAIIAAESGVLISLTGVRYGDEPHIDALLAGHAGDPLVVDRRGKDGNGECITIPRPAITLGLTAQPVVIADLGRRPLLRKRGLTARFLYSLPLDTLGHRVWDVPDVSQGSEATWSDAITTLAEYCYSRFDLNETTTVRLDMAASAALREFSDEIEPQLGPGGELRPIADWAGKLPGNTARIALLLQIMTDPPASMDTRPFQFRDIDADVMCNAIRLARYFRDHAYAAYDLIGTTEAHVNARHIVDWARRRQVSDTTMRDIHRSLRRTMPGVDQVRAAVLLLAEHGWLRLERRHPTGGRPPSERITFHPTLLSATR